MPSTPRTLSLKEWNRRQIAEAMEAFNRWVAGVNLKHEPTQNEILLWYIEHGGAAGFAERERQAGEGLEVQELPAPRESA